MSLQVEEIKTAPGSKLGRKETKNCVLSVFHHHPRIDLLILLLLFVFQVDCVFEKKRKKKMELIFSVSLCQDA